MLRESILLGFASMSCPAMNPIRRFSLRSPVSVSVFPFVRLHGPQSSTRFSSSFEPPSLLGMRWSSSRYRALSNVRPHPMQAMPCSARLDVVPQRLYRVSGQLVQVVLEVDPTLAREVQPVFTIQPPLYS